MFFIKSFVPQFFKKQLSIEALKGDVVHCPICDTGFKVFLPFEPGLRPHARCPKCNSLERNRLIWLYLQFKTGFFQHPWKLLHIAPNQALFNKFRNQSGLTYNPIDLETATYPASGVKAMNATNLAYRDDKFDFIICSHVLEHVKDDATAISELKRVLKAGGTGILLVPLDETRDESFEDATIKDPEERKRFFGQSDHVRIYGRDFPERLKNTGLSVNPVNFASEFSQKERFEYGLLSDETLWIISK